MQGFMELFAPPCPQLNVGHTGCFFFPPHLFPRLSVALTVLLGSLQAHDGHEGQKFRAQVCLGRGGEATGGRRVFTTGFIKKKILRVVSHYHILQHGVGGRRGCCNSTC